MDWLIATPVILLAVWMIVVANALLSGKGGEAAPKLSLTVLLWPPFLASTVAGYLFIVPLIFTPELFSDTPWLLNLGLWHCPPSSSRFSSTAITGSFQSPSLR